MEIAEGALVLPTVRRLLAGIEPGPERLVDPPGPESGFVHGGGQGKPVLLLGGGDLRVLLVGDGAQICAGGHRVVAGTASAWPGVPGPLHIAARAGGAITDYRCIIDEFVMSERPRVVIVGGGFGGLRVAQRLAKAPVEVVLVDRRNHHLFQPLLYQVATAGLSPADIARPIRSVLRDQANARVLLDEVVDIDLENQTVQLREGSLHYDWLVLTAGAGNAYFGHDQWKEHAPGLKSIEDALSIRRRVLLAYERAENGAAEALTFVVVGGGATGVELAGALREIASETIPADFRNVDTRSARIVLIEGADRLLPGMSEAASVAALKTLRAMNVEVRLETRVTDIDEQGVSLGEERLVASNVIWAAGVKASGLSRALGTRLDRSGRVEVEPDCSVPGHSEVFVIGDMAALTDVNGVVVPGVAQGALQMGDHVAAIVRGAARSPFAYNDKGSMATIGRARAVADVFGRTWKGLPAWLLWCAVHIAFLVGFRNKVFVMLSWLWSYVRNGRGARLITGGP